MSIKKRRGAWIQKDIVEFLHHVLRQSINFRVKNSK